MMQVYADHAATTRVSQRALAAMQLCLNGYFGNPSSMSRPGRMSREVLDHARARIASCLVCDAREVYFTSGGTEADAIAIQTGVDVCLRTGKRHILTTAIEHHAVLNGMVHLAHEHGLALTCLDVSEDGIVSVPHFMNAIRPDTGFVSVMFANNEIGTLQPIAEIAAFCRSEGILFHTDAVQAVGHIPIDLTGLDIDLLSAASHKFYGPVGAGILYARHGLQPSRVYAGGMQERGVRSGTENYPAIAGMAEALVEATERMDADMVHGNMLRDRLIDGLERLPGVTLNGDRRRRLPYHVNICINDIDGEEMLLYLDAHGIYASMGAACMSGAAEKSHVLRAIGRSEKQIKSAIRLTLGRLNTLEDVAYILDVMREGIKKLL